MAYDGSLIFDTKIDDSGFKKGVSKLGSVGKGAVKGIVKGAAAAATAIIGIGVASIKVGSGFEAGMSRVNALTGATQAEFEKLEKKAMELGKTTVFSATQASEGMSYLAMAGFDTNEIIAAMPGLLDAAAAGQTELGTAADITSNILSGFGIEATETGRVADVLTKAFTSSNTSLESLGETMKYAGPVAKAAGFSLEETAAAAGILGDAGIQGSMAGTVLRGVMLRLVNPPKQAADALDELGVSLLDAKGEMKPFPDIIEELEKATEGMTEAQKTAIISQVAGQNAASGLLAIMDAGSDTLREFGDELENSAGTAAEIAAKQLDNLQGDVQLLKSALEGAGIAIYKQFDVPLRDVTQTATGYIEKIADTLTAHDDARESMEELGMSANQIEEELRGVPSGFEAAVETLGEIIADMILRLAEAAPRFLEMGVNLVKAFLDGLRQNLPEISQSAVELIQGFATAYLELLPEIIVLGIELIANLIQGIAEMIPELIPVAVQSIDTIMTSLMDNLPLIIEAGIQIIVALIEGIADNLPQLIDQSIDLIVLVADALIDNLPLIIEAGLKLIVALVKGIIDSLPKLIEEAPRIINDFADSIYNQLPTILKVGVKLLLEIIKGLIQTIPTLIANLPQIIMAIVNAFTLYNWWNLGKGVISKLGQGISGMVSNLGSIARDLASKAIQAIKNIFTQAPSVGSGFVRGIITGIGNLIGSLLSTITNLGSRAITSVKTALAPSKLVSIGSNMVKGIWNGISNVTGWILSKIKGFGSSVMKGIKGIFGIKSPSTLMRDEIGKNLALGIGVGFEAETDGLNKDINKEMTTLARSMQATVDFETANTSARMVAGNGFNGRVSSISNDDNSENNIIITDNEFHIREEADIEKVAIELDRLRVRRSRV